MGLGKPDIHKPSAIHREGQDRLVDIILPYEDANKGMVFKGPQKPASESWDGKLMMPGNL